MANIPGQTKYPIEIDTTLSLIEVANKVSTSTIGDINESDDTVTVDSTEGFPDSGFIVLDLEYCYYTGKTDTTLIGVARGQQGSLAAPHSGGTLIKMNLLAIHHQVLVDALIALETKLGKGASIPQSDSILRGSNGGSSTWTEVKTLTGQESVIGLPIGSEAEIFVNHSTQGAFTLLPSVEITAPTGIRAQVIAQGASGKRTTNTGFVVLLKNISFGNYGNVSFNFTWIRKGI